jgi:hypothetical protein
VWSLTSLRFACYERTLFPVVPETNKIVSTIKVNVKFSLPLTKYQPVLNQVQENVTL